MKYNGSSTNMSLRSPLAILEIALLLTVTTVLEFVVPEINSIVAPLLFLVVWIHFWRAEKMRWLFFAAIAIIPFPELQSQILGPLEIHHVLLLACLFSFGTRWLFLSPKRLPRLSWALAFYYIVITALTLTQFNHVASWHRLFILAFLFLIGFLAPQFIKTRQDLKELFWVLLGTSAATTLVGLGALYLAAATRTFFENPYLHISIVEGVPRIAGTLLDSNFFGHHLLLILPSLCALIFIEWKRWTRLTKIALILLTVILGAAFLLTYSRSSYLGLGAALLIIVLVTRIKTIWKAILILVLAGLAATALYPPFPFYSIYRTPSVLLPTETKEQLLFGFDPRAVAEEYIKRVQNDPTLSDEERDQLLARDVSSDSLGYRITFWKAGLAMFRDHPITGVGVGQFRYQFKSYADLTFLREPDAHNIYVEQLAETGIVGFGFLIALLIATIRSLISSIRTSKAKGGIEYIAAIGTLASLAGILVQSTLLGGFGAMSLFLLLGITPAIARLTSPAKQKSSQEKRVRVAIITTTTKKEGPGNMLVTMLRHIDRAKVEPIVITILSGGYWDAWYRKEGIQRVNLGMFKPLDLLAPLILWFVLLRSKPDLVHTQLLRGDVYGRWAAIRAGIPFISVVHNMDRWKRSGSLGHRFSSWFDAQGLQQAAGIVAVSRAVKEDTIGLQDIQADRISVIPNAVDAAAFQYQLSAEEETKLRTELAIPATAKIVGTVARLVAQKAPDVWVRAAAEIVSRRPDTYFIWIDIGPLKEETEALIKRLGLEKHFRMLGRRLDIPRLLALMDVFMLSSLFEGLPMALLEAMAAGKACVATSVSGIPELLLDGQTGLLAPPNDPKALATAVEKVLSSDELKKTIGKNARALIEQKYQAQGMGHLYQALYLRTIS
jgi:glycosyltransferase involved in cell wall biosynthesis/O-antigen ligase